LLLTGTAPFARLQFPITAIREIKILRALKHGNIVLLKEIVTSRPNGSASSFAQNDLIASATLSSR
jgi:hypothetical protein